MNWRKHASPAVFGLAALMFLMPFGLVSCNGRQVAQVSGVQLVTGTSISTGMGSQQIPAQPSVLVPLLAAVAAVVVGLSAYGWRHVLNAILGVVGAAGLYLFLQGAVSSASSNGYEFQAGTGLNGAMLLFAVGSGLSVFLAVDSGRTATTHESLTPRGAPPPVLHTESGANFCPGCGAAVRADDRFCTACGQDVTE